MWESEGDRFFILIVFEISFAWCQKGDSVVLHPGPGGDWGPGGGFALHSRQVQVCGPDSCRHPRLVIRRLLVSYGPHPQTWHLQGHNHYSRFCVELLQWKLALAPLDSMLSQTGYTCVPDSSLSASMIYLKASANGSSLIHLVQLQEHHISWALQCLFKSFVLQMKNHMPVFVLASWCFFEFGIISTTI